MLNGTENVYVIKDMTITGWKHKNQKDLSLDNKTLRICEKSSYHLSIKYELMNDFF